MVEMMLFLTGRELDIFCRLFIVLLIGSTCGPIFFKWTSEDVWLLDALGWWQSFGLSTTRVDVGTLVDNNMCSCLLLLLFWWIIRVTTVCDPWDVDDMNLDGFASTLQYWGCVRHFDTEVGVEPYFEKNVCSNWCFQLVNRENSNRTFFFTWLSQTPVRILKKIWLLS